MSRITLKQDEYHPISESLLGALERYVNDRIPPGGFTTSVLCNDLVGAVSRADTFNKTNLHNIVGYIYNNLPGNCWGGPGAVKKWLEGDNNDESGNN